MNFIRIISVILFFFVLCTPALGGIADEVARDLKVEAGIVIMPAGGEFLVDLDAGNGLRPGDLLAVVKAGEKIIHPTTHQVLGTTAEVKGILQITRVLSGYSYARLVSGQGEIAKGDAVRRFESIGAAFWDYTGGGRDLYNELRLSLPDLEWGSYVEAAGKDPVKGGSPLTFVHREGRLEVRGPAFEELYIYRVKDTVGSPSQPDAAPGAAAIAASAPVSSGAIVQKRRNDTAGLSFPAEFEGTVVGIEVGDFDGDGRRQIAVAFPRHLEVGVIADGKFERRQTIDLGLGRKVIGLDGGDPNGDGRTELYITAARDGGLSSLIVGFKDGSLQVVQEDIPWYFRSVQLPGDGAVLLGQRMGGLEADFSGAIFRVSIKEGRVVEGADVPAPRDTTLYGFLPFESPEGEILFLQFTAWDRLRVVRFDGEVLWESADTFGGSEAFIERRDPSKNPADGPAMRSAFMQARMAVAPGGEILIPLNDGKRLLSASRNFKKSRLMAMTWSGFAMQELWHTVDQDAYLADFRVADVNGDGIDELVQALVFSKEGFRSKGRSAIGVFTLP